MGLAWATRKAAIPTSTNHQSLCPKSWLAVYIFAFGKVKNAIQAVKVRASTKLAHGALAKIYIYGDSRVVTRSLENCLCLRLFVGIYVYTWSYACVSTGPQK